MTMDSYQVMFCHLINFFSRNTIEKERPLFFNEVPVPRFWEIEGSNQSAVIKDRDKIRGKIVYQKEYGNRAVASVEWLNKSGHVQFIDYYNRHGFRFAQLVMDDHQNQIIKRFLIKIMMNFWWRISLLRI